MDNRAKVIQDKEKPVSTQILAESIVELSTGIKKLLSGGLNDRAVEVLLRDSSNVSITDIRKVMKSLGTLAQNYVRR